MERNLGLFRRPALASDRNGGSGLELGRPDLARLPRPPHLQPNELSQQSGCRSRLPRDSRGSIGGPFRPRQSCPRSFEESLRH